MIGAFCVQKEEDREGYLYADVRVMGVPRKNPEHFIHWVRTVL